MWHAQVKEVEAVAAAEEGAVKEEDVADAAAANRDGTSATAEPEPAASSTPAAAPEKAAVKPDEAPAKVFPGSSHPNVPHFSFLLKCHPVRSVLRLCVRGPLDKCHGRSLASCSSQSTKI